MPRREPLERKRERKHLSADPEPWKGARRPPEDRPRHESAEPEDSSDPAQASGAIAAESWGEVIETCSDDMVDGDFNGSPERESLDRTQRWAGVDALQGMVGAESELPRESRTPAEVLADAIADRRSVLAARLDDARELGIGTIVESALASTEPAASHSSVTSDEDELRDQLALLDGALEELEGRSQDS
jgi:hypothetical protein